MAPANRDACLKAGTLVVGLVALATLIPAEWGMRAPFLVGGVVAALVGVAAGARLR